MICLQEEEQRDGRDVVLQDVRHVDANPSVLEGQENTDNRLFRNRSI